MYMYFMCSIMYNSKHNYEGTCPVFNERVGLGKREKDWGRREKDWGRREKGW